MQMGPPGADGTIGLTGAPGPDGSSAYDVAVANGFIGTEADWLLSLNGTDAPMDYAIVHPRTSVINNELQGVSMIPGGPFAGGVTGYTDSFKLEIDRIGFLEAVEVSILTPPIGSVGFALGSLNYDGTFNSSGSSVRTFNPGDSSSFLVIHTFAWTTLAVGSHEVVLNFEADPLTGIADKQITIHLNII